MRANGVLATLVLAAGTLIAGCASGPPRQTTADLIRAQTLVAQAESTGAQQYAAAELRAARDKVQQADQLADHHPARADQLANEAAADAQLASARAQNAKAQQAVEDVNRSLQALREESEQSGGDAAATPPSTEPDAAPPPPQTSPQD